jgi:hypothetical protein
MRRSGSPRPTRRSSRRPKFSACLGARSTAFVEGGYLISYLLGGKRRVSLLDQVLRRSMPQRRSAVVDPANDRQAPRRQTQKTTTRTAVSRQRRVTAMLTRLTPPPPETSEAAMTSRGLLDDDDLTKADPSEDSRPSRGIGDA